MATSIKRAFCPLRRVFAQFPNTYTEIQHRNYRSGTYRKPIRAFTAEEAKIVAKKGKLSVKNELTSEKLWKEAATEELEQPDNALPEGMTYEKLREGDKRFG